MEPDASCDRRRDDRSRDSPHECFSAGPIRCERHYRCSDDDAGSRHRGRGIVPLHRNSGQHARSLTEFMATPASPIREAIRSAAEVLTVVVMALIVPCVAQTAWKPEKPVEFVVLSSPGGGNDKTARLLQKIWRESKWLENVNVLNRPGGGGALAYTHVSQHPGDAHYIAVVRKGLLTNHILGRSTLPYTELTPLVQMGNEASA